MPMGENKTAGNDDNAGYGDGRNEAEYKKNSSYVEPTKEQLEKERKKRRRDEIFAAVGDGIMALSNLYFTTQGAPSSYTGHNTMSEKTRARYDKLKADREKEKETYYHGLERARQMDNAERAQKWQEYIGAERLKAQQADEERAKAREARDKEMHDLNMQLKNQQISKAEYDAKVAGIQAEYAPLYEQSKIDKNKASADASKSRAGYYASGGGSGKDYGEFRGTKYKTKADYESAVYSAANEAGVNIYDTEVTEYNYAGEPIKQRKRKRSVAEVVAELNRMDKEKEEQEKKKKTGGWSLK